MSRTKEFDKSLFEEKYNSVLQILFLLADTQNLVGEVARGSGKSTEILGSRIVRVAYSMPRSTIGLVGATYVSLLENVLPAVLQYFNTHYKRGVHFEVGKEPPSHFKRPLQQIFNWKHTISTVWGSVIVLISIDRLESALGKNLAHIVIDEALRIPEDRIAERVFPTLRGDKEMHGNSPYFGGLSIFSSAPNFETDHDWFQKYKSDMDLDKIQKIMYVAFRVKHEEALYHQALQNGDKKEIKRTQKFIKKWQPWLDEARKSQTTYLSGSAFTNLAVLGLDYIERQFKGIKDFEKFKTSILNIKQKQVSNMFFAKFTKKNVFSDSYIYQKNNDGTYKIDDISLEDSIKHSSLDLKYCNKNRALVAGWDPGGFMSLVVAQHDKQKKEFRVLKSFYHITPNQHKEQAEAFAKFFSNHRTKTLYLYYDRAGNKRLKNKPSGDLHDTDAKLLKRYLEKKGWNVILKSKGQRVIFHREHFALLSIIFDENFTEKILIDENEADTLISSIYYSPLKKGRNGPELDKSAERNLPFEQQALFSPQIASALTYLLWGIYSSNINPNSLNAYDYNPS